MKKMKQWLAVGLAACIFFGASAVAASDTSEQPTALSTEEPTATPVSESAMPTAEDTPAPQPSENALAVQRMLDALPSVNEVGTMDEDAISAACNQANAAQTAYEALSADEQAMLHGAEMLQPLLAALHEASAASVEAPVSYRITVQNDEVASHGKVSNCPTTASAGESVMLQAIPNAGYTVKDVRILCNAQSVEVAAMGAVLDGYRFTMPAGDVEIFVTFEPCKYKISIPAILMNGTASASPNPARKGETVQLTATPVPGYKLKEFQVYLSDKTTRVTLNSDNSFTMPEDDVIVYPQFVEQGTVVSPDAYRIAIAESSYGKVTVAGGKTEFLAGDTVQLKVAPEAGYRLKSITAVSAIPFVLDDVELTKNDDGYTFTMPAFDVQVSAAFEQLAPTYTISIPSSVNLGSQENLPITVSDLANLPEGSSITIHASSQIGGYLVQGETKIPYTYTQSLRFQQNETQQLSIAVDSSDIFGKPAGEYSDVLTFTYSISSGD